ncbi:MAG: YgiQ family radical SAM protein [Spirochaeta sp.]
MSTHETTTRFLPISRADMQSRGWEQLDFIMVSGDAYVDHPSFGAALIARLLESRGFRVGMICQPDWKNIESFQVLGRPRLGFLISGGNMDSMVLHYTSSQKPRSEDLYSPGKQSGLRPNRATIVYAAAVRQAYKKVPVIIGGVETSLRRLGHYDYWSDKVRRSILLDSKADLAVYGMGELAIIAAAERLDAASKAGLNPVSADLSGIRGTLYKLTAHQADDTGNIPDNAIELPSFSRITEDRRAYAEGFSLQYRNTDPFSAKPLIERYPSGETVVQMPPQMPLSTEIFDSLYELPFARDYHPVYESAGGIAAIEEVKFSLISARGCFGACSFCALTFHQGRIIQTRSHDSLLREAVHLTQLPGFKGYIHDVGGPTANFRTSACKKMAAKGSCTDKNCLAPSVCTNLDANHEDYLSLLRKLRALPGVKKVFIRSGIRYDYLLEDSDEGFFRDLVQHHVSGQLKVAPEHVSKNVLRLMGKPELNVFQRFQKRFRELNSETGKKQFLVPYFISSHPGSTLEDAIELAEYLRDERISPQQVQDFYPTPGTLSTCMYFTQLDPRDMKPVFIPRSGRDKAMQRALLQYRSPKNHDLVRTALRQCNREDLIGSGPRCLVPSGSSAPQRNVGAVREKRPRKQTR